MVFLFPLSPGTAVLRWGGRVVVGVVVVVGEDGNGFIRLHKYHLGPSISPRTFAEQPMEMCSPFYPAMEFVAHGGNPLCREPKHPRFAVRDRDYFHCCLYSMVKVMGPIKKRRSDGST